MDNVAQSSNRETFGNKTCEELMQLEPLMVEKSTPLHELSGCLCESENRYFSDGFIITKQGKYIGVGNVRDLLREITKVQIEAGRYANPLTLLSGYVPVNKRIEQLLQSGKSFAVCHCDLDNFKAYNNVYGYRKGDELIQYTARILANVCNRTLDFIGHLGGDDFILVMQSPDWELRCNRMLTGFAQTSSILLDRDRRSIGGYLKEDRQGRMIHYPLPTLSIGAFWVIPELSTSHHEISEAAAAAIIMAKEIPGNSLFIERRRPHPLEESEAQHEVLGNYFG